jgi:oligopeptide transport system substrate-binding protein
VNREILVEKVLGAGEVPGWGVTPPGLADYPPVQMEEAGWSQQRREDTARQLFRQAGFREGDDLRLEIRYNTSSVHRRMAVAVAAMWKQVLGVSAQLVNEEWKVFVNNRRLGTVTEVFRAGWIADYADPSSFLDLFAGDSPLNSSFYHEGRYDSLLNTASHQSGSLRLQNLRQAEALLLQDMPLIPLYYYVSRHLVRPGLGGYENNVRDIHLSRYLVRQGD